MSSRQTIFTLSGIRRGFVAAQSFGIGVFLYGVAFGLLAREINLSVLEALLMSGIVYSGSAQIAAISSFGPAGLPTGSAVFAILLTILMLNARYMLYGAALRPWLGQANGWQAYSSLAILGDGNWLMSMKAHEAGEGDAGYVLGSGLAGFVPWVGGTLAGVWTASLLANPAALGMDFMLVAFSAAMGVSMLRGRSDFVILISAAVTALVADRLFPGPWTIVLAGLAGAVTAFVRYKPESAS
ncbi:MAG: AzlC family ABC transporter permease [Beijerinckiaceae bacterium]